MVNSEMSNSEYHGSRTSIFCHINARGLDPTDVAQKIIEQPQQYNKYIICEPLLTETMLLEPELNSRCNLQDFGFNLQELQVLICFMQTLIKISNPQRRNPKRAVKNGHNWPIYIYIAWFGN